MSAKISQTDLAFSHTYVNFLNFTGSDQKEIISQLARSNGFLPFFTCQDAHMRHLVPAQLIIDSEYYDSEGGTDQLKELLNSHVSYK